MKSNLDSTHIVAFGSQKHTALDFVKPVDDGSGFDPVPSRELKKFGYEDN